MHEALTDINAGRFDDAVKKLKENLPTQDRIAEYLERGMNPTLANPDGQAKAQADQERKAPIEPTLTLPVSAPVPETASFEDWQKHQFPTPEYKLKSFADASENFSRGYTHSFQKSGFKKIIDVLRDKPDQVRSNAQDFAQLAMVLRGVAENANLLAAAISKALTPSPGPLPTTEPEEQPAEQNTDQTDFDLDTLLNEEHEPQTSELRVADAGREARRRNHLNDEGRRQVGTNAPRLLLGVCQG